MSLELEKINQVYFKGLHFKDNKKNDRTSNSLERSPEIDTLEKIKKSAIKSLKDKISSYKTRKSLKEEIAWMNHRLKDAQNTRVSQIYEIEQKDRVIKSKDEQLLEKSYEIKELKEKLEEMQKRLESEKEFSSQVVLNKSSYEELIAKEYAKAQTILDDVTLDYDPLSAPNQYKIPNRLKEASTVINFENIKDLETQIKKEDNLNTDNLIEHLKQQGRLKFKLEDSENIAPTISPLAYLTDEDEKKVGKVIETDLTLEFGKRINWTNEKIARDIMQNFYDGHGNTLDGVDFDFEKLDDGKTKITIKGLGMFDCKNLQYMGSGSKRENPFNAGGFGEGAKILVACLLGSNKTENVKYSCADWELEFFGLDGLIQRKLTKTQNPIKGNTLEFVTNDDDLTEKLIKSINYFKHSTNPDFNKYSFDCKDFGFEILPPNQKGNLYLTQRFEFMESGNWDNSLDGLKLYFNRKPDAKEFKELTGKDFSEVRDRINLTGVDLELLTYYFAHKNMSDDELAQAITSTMPFWDNLLPRKECAQLRFVRGLLHEAKNRKLAIDFGDKKLACESKYMMPHIVTRLIEKGYTLLPAEFRVLKINTADEVFKAMSNHSAIQPTENQIKKLKILNEAISSIQESITANFEKQLNNIKIKYEENTHNKIAVLYVLAMQFENTDTRIKEITNSSDMVTADDIARLSEEERLELLKVLEERATEFLHNIKADNSEWKIDDVLNSICRYSFDENTNKQIEIIKKMALITSKDIKQPKYIFNKDNELKNETLAEAIINDSCYEGHWVDGEYLDKSSFEELCATWLHEICHKKGGDGESSFTYALTDLLKLLITKPHRKCLVKLEALEKVFNEID